MYVCVDIQNQSTVIHMPVMRESTRDVKRRNKIEQIIDCTQGSFYVVRLERYLLHNCPLFILVRWQYVIIILSFFSSYNDFWSPFIVWGVYNLRIIRNNRIIFRRQDVIVNPIKPRVDSTLRGIWFASDKVDGSCLHLCIIVRVDWFDQRAESIIGSLLSFEVWARVSVTCDLALGSLGLRPTGLLKIGLAY